MIKFKKIGVSVCVAAISGTIVAGTSAGAEVLTHQAQINVSGKVGTDYTGRNIMLMITDEQNGNVLYIDQSTVDEYGDYSFRGKLKDDGATGYKAYVNCDGENVSDTITTATSFNDFYSVSFAFSEDGATAKSAVTFGKNFKDIDFDIKTAKAVTAYYDKDGKLISCKAGSSGENFSPITVSDRIPEGTDSMRCFLWSGEEKNIPLAEAKERIVNQTISTWGDSLTICCNTGLKEQIANYDDYDIDKNGAISYSEVLEHLTGKKVYNHGVGGENALEIAVRQGALKLCLKSGITIPTECDKVAIDVYTINPAAVGQNVRFDLMRQEAESHAVTLNGVEGKLSCEYPNGKMDYETPGQYYFTRNEPGESVDVDADSQIIFKEAGERCSDINVIYIGTNGGYGGTVEGLMSIIDAMIDNITDKGKEYIVVGLPHGTDEYEKVMWEKYGDRFVPLRSILRKNGEFTMQKYNITKNAKDNERIARGEIPWSFMAAANDGIDFVHMSAVGYYIVGNEIYEAMLRNGIVVEE